LSPAHPPIAESHFASCSVRRRPLSIIPPGQGNAP
jgi:hypothetical protein